MQKKNEKIILDIVDMTSEGLGIAKCDNQVFFVKDAILGDKVIAIVTKTNKKNNVVYAKKIELIKSSEYRARTDCVVCEPCGGCQVMALDYKKQTEMKLAMVKNNLKRIGKFDEKEIEKKCEGIVKMDKPYRFRNKIQVPFTKKDNKIISGFYASRTHHIIENDDCIAGFEEAKYIISIMKGMCIKNKWLSIYDEEMGSGILRELMLRKGNNSNEISMTLIVNDKKVEITKYQTLVKSIIDEYDKIKGNNDTKIVTATLNINTENNNVLFGKENVILYGNGYIEDEILGLRFHISPESFYQVNNVQTEKLYKTALDFLDDVILENNENIDEALDLYCGIGTITLNLSKKVKHIIGLEIVKKAIENAKDNASINGINNVDFVCMDASGIENDVNLSKATYDLISVDPPRKGLDKETVDFIIKKAPKYLLYISCDSATLSRDLSILCDKEKKVCYNIYKIKCVDMFPHTMHVETICLMEKSNENI